MSEEIEGLLETLENEHLCKKQYKLLEDYINNLQQENQQLKEKINTYENPDDLTLFYMWLDEKAKDKIKELKQKNESLRKRIETIKRRRKKQTQRINKYKLLIADMQNSLALKNQKIKELEKRIQEYSDAEMQRQEDEMMDYLIKEEEKFNDYSFMEE